MECHAVNFSLALWLQDGEFSFEDGPELDGDFLESRGSKLDKVRCKPGMVVHACNPNTWETKAEDC